MERKNKGILILLIALLCFVAVGCGNNNSSSDDNDSKESKSEKKKDKEKDTEKETEKETKEEKSEKTISCTMEEDGGKFVASFTQDQKTYEFTSGKMTMSLDVDGSGFEDLSASDFEDMFCSPDADVPYTNCKASLSNNNLTVKYDIDVEKFINEEYNVDELNENSLSELKSELEKEGFSCRIS